MSTKAVWRVERNTVLRAGVVIAAIFQTADRGLAWRGLGIERFGFTNEADVLTDVKYFYRHPPVTKITFQSGRVVVS